jgi:hypothetical protein
MADRIDIIVWSSLTKKQGLSPTSSKFYFRRSAKFPPWFKSKSGTKGQSRFCVGELLL